MNLFNIFGIKLGNGYRSNLILAALFLFYFIKVCYSKILTNSYLVEFKNPIDRSLADQIASRNGFINAGPVS